MNPDTLAFIRAELAKRDGDRDALARYLVRHGGGQVAACRRLIDRVIDGEPGQPQIEHCVGWRIRP